MGTVCILWFFLVLRNFWVGTAKKHIFWVGTVLKKNHPPTNKYSEALSNIYLKEFQGNAQKKSFIQFLEYVGEEGSKIQLHNY